MLYMRYFYSKPKQERVNSMLSCSAICISHALLINYSVYGFCVDICYLNNLSRGVTSSESISICIKLFAHRHEDVFVMFCILYVFFIISDAFL